MEMSKEPHRVLDGLEVEGFRNGDEAVVIYPDGRREVYVFVEDEVLENSYTITPNGEEVLKRIKEVK